MIEVLDRPKSDVPTQPKWRDENTGIVRRHIIKLDNSGEEMAFAGPPIEAKTGFRASVETWDEIRKSVTRFPWLSYKNYTVRAPHQLKSWSRPRSPQFWPIGTPGAILLSPNGDSPGRE